MGRKKMDAKKPGDKGGVYQEPLECALDDVQYRDRAEKLANVDKRIDEVDSERREKAKGYSDKLKELREERAPLITAVETHKETRMVECREFRDYERGSARIVRLDTNEEVRTRPLEAEERQEGLGLGFDGAHPPAAA